MTEKLSVLFYDAIEMMEIFRSLSEAEKAVALAYAAGQAGCPLNTIIYLQEDIKQGSVL